MIEAKDYLRFTKENIKTAKQYEAAVVISPSLQNNIHTRHNELVEEARERCYNELKAFCKEYGHTHRLAGEILDEMLALFESKILRD